MKRFIVACTCFLAAILSYTGCGQSPDELYEKAKMFISERDTLDEGLSLLLKFEQKFPDDPRAPEVLLSTATVYQAQQDFDNAIETFQRLIKQYPGTPEEYKGKFLLGYLYYDEIGDTKRATEIFTEFITSYPDSDLTASAIVLMENIDRPIEEWAVFEDIEAPAATDNEPEYGN